MEQPPSQGKTHLSSKSSKTVILVHVWAERSMKLNGYPQKRPKCTGERIIQKK